MLTDGPQAACNPTAAAPFNDTPQYCACMQAALIAVCRQIAAEQQHAIGRTGIWGAAACAFHMKAAPALLLQASCGHCT